LDADPQAVLYGVNTNNFGGGNSSTVCNVTGLPNEELIMKLIKNKEAELGTFFPILTVFQAFLNWPSIAIRENRVLIENQLGVNSPTSDFEALLTGPTGHPEVLFLVMWNHIALYKEIINSVIAGEYQSGTINYISTNSDMEKVLFLSRLSPLIPNDLKNKMLNLEKKYITKDYKNNILCEPSVVNNLKDTYEILNSCISTDSAIFRKDISPKIKMVNYFNTSIC